MELKNRIEAILLAANRALTLKDICELLEIDNSEHESEVMNSIYKLKDEFADKPYDLVEVSSGYRVQIHHDFAGDIAKLWEVKAIEAFKSNFGNSLHYYLYATSNQG